MVRCADKAKFLLIGRLIAIVVIINLVFSDGRRHIGDWAVNDDIRQRALIVISNQRTTIAGNCMAPALEKAGQLADAGGTTVKVQVTFQNKIMRAIGAIQILKLPVLLI